MPLPNLLPGHFSRFARTGLGALAPLPPLSNFAILVGCFRHCRLPLDEAETFWIDYHVNLMLLIALWLAARI